MNYYILHKAEGALLFVEAATRHAGFCWTTRFECKRLDSETSKELYFFDHTADSPDDWTKLLKPETVARTSYPEYFI
jgi:hypothetical protein